MDGDRLERVAFGVFAIGGSLSGGYLLGLGQWAGWALILAVLLVGAVRARGVLRGRGPASEDDSFGEVFAQITARARTVGKLLEACRARGAADLAIPLAALRSAVASNLGEAERSLRRWRAASAGPAPRREELEARLRACERLKVATADEHCQEELEATESHQRRTMEMIEESERVRWAFLLGLERLLSSLEAIDLSLRMSLTREKPAEPTDLEALVEAMTEAAGTLSRLDAGVDQGTSPA